MKILMTAILIFMGLSGSALCQTQMPKTASDLARYLGADRERLLLEGAKKEGKVVWYTSLTIYKEMAKAFESKYPGVTVERYRAAATIRTTKMLAEAQMKRYIADAIETPPGGR